jgi:hypothetical protein
MFGCPDRADCAIEERLNVVSSVITFVALLSKSLDAALPRWRSEIEDLGQVRLIRARTAGWTPTDAEVLQGLLLAFLSAMTDWRKIQAARGELAHAVDTWDPAHFATLTNSRLLRLENWFLKRRLGSVLLRKQLEWMRASAGILVQMGRETGGVDAFLGQRKKSHDLALMLGDPKSNWKLPGMGVPLAAEFLKNLGFDDFKPDRHLIRMLGPQRLALCGKSDASSIRRWGIQAAQNAGLLAAELDQMLWLYCARGYGNVCSANPKCQKCLMRRKCQTGNGLTSAERC